jgi:TRAP-type C4-dicarboxylate transport system permease small subunit
MRTQTKVCLLISLLLPFTYFLFINVGPIRYIDAAGNQMTGPGGIQGFIEFYGLVLSLAFYFAATLSVFSVIFFSLNAISKKLGKDQEKP